MSNTQNRFEDKYDAIVVGARCAGASTAMLLARAGAKVLLIDRQDYGTDRTSTHALMRSGVFLLNQWKILDRVLASDTSKVVQTTFHYGSEEIRIDIKPDQGVDCLCAPRRTVLDRILVDSAAEAGADVYHGVLLKSLRFEPDGRVSGAFLRDREGNESEVRAGIVIGADGRQSTVARLVNAKTYLQGQYASGYVYGYFSGINNDGYHWYFEEDVAAGTVPTNGGQHCVFVGVPREKFVETFRKNIEGGFERVALANSPELAETIRRASQEERLRGFAGDPGFLKQSFGPGWALVGDAGYFKDPLTAHGITDAFRDAELLSRAILAGQERAMVDYQDVRDELSRPLFEVTDAIASFEWDSERVKEHHIALNKAMKRETEYIRVLTMDMPLAA